MVVPLQLIQISNNVHFLSYLPLIIPLLVGLGFFVLVLIIETVIIIEIASLFLSLLIFARNLKGTITIDPLHQDGCGGLSGIGSFYSSVAGSIGVVGVLHVLTSGFFMIQYVGIIFAFIVIIMGLVFFYFPHSEFHSILRDEKKKALKEWRKKIPEKVSYKDTTEKLLEVQFAVSVYDSISRMESYAFSTFALERFIALLISPLIVSIVIEFFL
jgi:uncharacterized membrane protein